MDHSDATAERERRLGCGHPIPSLLRRKGAIRASLPANCSRDRVRQIECDGLVHIISVSVMMCLGEFLASLTYNISVSALNLGISRVGEVSRAESFRCQLCRLVTNRIIVASARHYSVGTANMKIESPSAAFPEAFLSNVLRHNSAPYRTSLVYFWNLVKRSVRLLDRFSAHLKNTRKSYCFNNTKRVSCVRANL
jgi:hypothetical protein